MCSNRYWHCTETDLIGTDAAIWGTDTAMICTYTALRGTATVWIGSDTAILCKSTSFLGSIIVADTFILYSATVLIL